MNSLAAHRVLIGLLVVALGFAVWKSSTQKLDGNPSGLDIVANQKIAAIQKDSTSDVECLQSKSCTLYLEFHYLSLTPVPQCLPRSDAYVCPSSLPTQPPYPDRILRTCKSGELCMSVGGPIPAAWSSGTLPADESSRIPSVSAAFLPIMVSSFWLQVPIRHWREQIRVARQFAVAHPVVKPAPGGTNGYE